MWTLQKCIISTWVSHGGGEIIIYSLSFSLVTKMLRLLVRYWRGLGIRVVELS